MSESHMKERPILFSAPMVQAILEGRKTQTRRICKPQPHSVGDHFSTRSHGTLMIRKPGEEAWKPIPCPYGTAGDRLWVRETWCNAWDDERDRWHDPPRYHYRADGYEVRHVDSALKSPWRPSIHMPRAASRITLEITNVRAERLNDISNEDAAAEGWPGPDERNSIASAYPIAWYAALWGSINGRGSYDLNPWVWVIGFKRLTSS